MNRTYRVLISSVMAISIIVVSAVCWHSLEEIHYLKSFYPQQFTVEETFYANAVELVKVIIISLPFFLIVGTGLYLLRHLGGNPNRTLTPRTKGRIGEKSPYQRTANTYGGAHKHWVFDA